MSRIVCLSVIGMMAFAVTASGDCPYVNNFGVPTMIEGAATLKDVLDLIGEDLGFGGAVEDWDVDGNGVPDVIQLEVLTYILCLPPDTEHPLIDVAQIQDAFIQNLVEFYTLSDYLIENVEALVAAAPVLRDVGVAIKAAAANAVPPMSDDVIDPSVFGAANLPAEWVGKTYEELGEFMRYVGAGIFHFTDELRAAAPMLGTDPLAHLVAAMIGMDEEFIDIILNANMSGVELYPSMQQAMALANVDWAYILALFPSLDEGEIDAIADAMADAGLSEFELPDLEVDIFTWHDEDLAAAIADAYAPELDADDVIGALAQDLSRAVEMRVVHASPDADAVDVCAQGAVLLNDLSFKEISDYAVIQALEADAYQYHLALTTVGGDCVGDALLSQTFMDLPNTGTLVALNTAANLEFLALADDNTLPSTGMAKVRFVHASPDAPAVDLWATDSGGLPERPFAGIPFKGASAYEEMMPGAYTLEFLEADKGDKALPAVDVVLNSGTVYTLFAMGLAADLEAVLNVDVGFEDIVMVSSERQRYLAGETVTLQTDVHESATVLSYAWYKDGAQIADADADTLVLTQAPQTASGAYTVVVNLELDEEKGIEIALSDTIQISVTQPTITIIGGPNFVQGKDIMLTASVGGDVVPISYFWTKDGADLGVPDANVLTVYEIDEDDAGLYEVEVTVALVGYPSITTTVKAERPVFIVSSLPVGGVFWLISLALVSGLAGVIALRRTRTRPRVLVCK